MPEHVDTMRMMRLGLVDEIQNALIRHFGAWSRNTPSAIVVAVSALRDWLEQEPRQPSTPGELADHVEAMIRTLPTEDRAKARQVIRRRMLHPEGHDPVFGYLAPPPSTGDNHAVRQPALCVRCGTSRQAHDVDGERSDCDGYVPEPR